MEPLRLHSNVSGLSLSVGMKVVALFTGKKGYAGWYGAVVASVDNSHQDEYLVEWEDGESKDTAKSSAQIALPFNFVQVLANRASSDAASSKSSDTDNACDWHCKSGMINSPQEVCHTYKHCQMHCSISAPILVFTYIHGVHVCSSKRSSQNHTA